MRLRLAIILTLVIGWATGPFAYGAGYAGWLVWLLSSFACPLVVAAIAPRYEILFAASVNLLVVVSLAFQSLSWEREHGIGPWRWSREALPLFLVVGLMSAHLGADIGLAFGLIRRSRRSSDTEP
jgi:hypothetical protein